MFAVQASAAVVSPGVAVSPVGAAGGVPSCAATGVVDASFEFPLVFVDVSTAWTTQ